ncbi:MAG: C40 family peptidase [Lachnospiraceae bacterium]|nr:C40 family peptidase [Lachnospiraceae bacterium]
MKNKREIIITACSIIIACIGMGVTAGSFAAGRAIASALQAGGAAVLADGVSAQGQSGDETAQERSGDGESQGQSGGTAFPDMAQEGEAGQNVASGDGTQQGSVSAGDVNVADNAALEVFSQAVSGGDAAQETDDEDDDEYANLAIADVNHYVNVRSMPSTDGEIVGKLYDGSVAQILALAGENDEWFQVVSGSVEGYVKAEFFIYGDEAAAVIDDYVIRYVTVQADRLNVRREPDINADRIGYISRGESVSLLEDCGEWLKVQYTEQKAGYVSAEYVMVTEEFIYAKSIEEEQAELAAQRELAERARAEEAARQEAAAAAGQGNAAQAAGQDIAALGEQPADGDSLQSTDNAAVGDGTDLAGQTYADNGELRAAIVEYAMQYLGNVYVHGGKSLDSGTDCSGFTCFIYADFGYSISRTPAGQLSSAGRSIDYSEIQPGDIICYSSNGGRSCTHVGLYIGDGQIIHAANSRKGVIISNADYSTIIGVKNVID